MANYSGLIQTINDSIKANGNQEITGPVLNSVLQAMVSALGEGYQFMGVATPDTNPGTPDGKVFYIAIEPGVYSNFNNIVLPDNDVFIIRYNSAGNFVVDELLLYKRQQGLIYACEELSKAEKVLVDYNHLCSIDSSNQQCVYTWSKEVYDSLWVKILPGTKSLTILNVVATRVIAFKNEYICWDNLVTNTTNISSPITVPSNANFAIITCVKANNTDGYERVRVVQEGDESHVYAANMRVKSTNLELFNPDEFIYGKALSGGKEVIIGSGILSNKIYVSPGTKCLINGLPQYGVRDVAYIARYDDNDNFIDRYTSSVLTNDGNNYLSGEIEFTPNGTCSYYRISLQINTSPVLVLANLSMVKSGTDPIYTAPGAISFEGIRKITPIPNKKLRILSIGNSYSLNYLAYAPFTLQQLMPSIDVKIGVLYLSGAMLSQHWSNIQSDAKSYIYYKYDNRKVSWDNGINNVSISQALADGEWDIIMLQQGSTASWTISTYQPYLNNIIKWIVNNFNLSLKFGWFEVMSRPATSSATWTEEEIAQHFTSIAENAQTVLQTTLVDFVVPIGAAVQNARRTSLNSLGDYERGMLCSSDGGHLQSGLPCQMAAYVSALSFLGQIGERGNGCLGDCLLLNTGNLTLKNAPQINGDPIGISKQNTAIAQACATMAMKNPFDVTDMTDLI